jgi:hypothetical protein
MSALLTPSIPSGSARRFDVDALDYFERVRAAGSTISAPATVAVEAFVRGLKSDGLWTSIIDMGLFAGVGDLTGCLQKLKHSGVATLTNNNFVGADYTATGASAGLQANAGTKTLTVGLNPSLRTQATNGIGFYSTINHLFGNGRWIIDGSGIRLGGNASPPTLTTFATQSTGTASYAATPGFNAMVSNGADARIVVNGAGLGARAFGTEGSYGSETRLFALNTGASPSNPRLSFYFYSTEMLEANVIKLSNRVNAVMTAFGANVY